ncbi:MAG: hypothetical protein ABSF87_05900 [Xanthobacteraceae bacterium]|jgi:hypothetical protein
MSDVDIELTVKPHAEDGLLYAACWPDGDGAVVHHIPEIFLDLVPFLAARQLVDWGYGLDRKLVVRLSGADYDLMRGATLGLAAATPLLNPVPVKYPAHAAALTEAVERGQAARRKEPKS